MASPGTPSVVQSGTLFDSAASNPLFYFIPSIMVSGQGHAAMGFSRAGAAVRPDAYTNGRLTVNTLGTLQAPSALTASSTSYNVGTPVRWGDYSYTSVDPVDDQTLWTVQEFCNATNSYAVRIGQLIAPPPPTPAVASPSFAAPGQASVNVTITGLASEVTAGAGYFDTTPAALWNPNRITATVSGGVTVNSISSVAPGSLVLNISTVGATVDNTANTITITNPDGQSRNAAIFNVFAPAAVKVESFTASAASPSPGGGGGGSDVTIQWTTGFEVDNLGFNLYRVTRSGRQLLTPRLIAGSALQSNATAQSTPGARVYSYTDHPPRGSRGVRYVLEDIDLNGNATVHGPIRITRNGPGQNGGASAGKLITLDELGGTADTTETAPFSPVEYTDDAPTFDKTADTSGPGGPAIKFRIRREGWYAVTGRDLFAAGLDPAVNPANLQLWSDGRQIAMLVRGEADGRLDDTDTVEFYGGGLNLPTTDTRTFWLSTGASAGLRIRQTAATTAPVATPSFPFTVERKDRLIYFSALLNGDAENFLGSVVSSTPVDQSITVQHLDTSPAKQCTLDVAVRGITTVSHAVNVSFNGIPVGQATFAATDLGRLTVTVPTQLVREGANVVRLTAVGAGYDVSAVDSIRLTYFHTAVADSDLLRASATGSSRGSGVTLGGFSNGTVRVVDVTTPAQPAEMLGTVAVGSGGYAATVLAPPGNRTFYAFTADQVRRPDAIVADRPSDLKSFDGADIVIVA
ncbi:MAG TPA: hypothetical protein PLF26_19910, partial [Blastocatellia bacterium]|nr:hypothetical protein [Blastocatellia bacterium]